VCGKSGLDQSGRRTSAEPARRSFVEKRKRNVASNDCDPTQLSSIKLAKCTDKE
jgi:hypothetical protein